MNKLKNSSVKREDLIKLRTKYGTSHNGTKKNIANGIYNLRQSSMSIKDILKIYPLLNNNNKITAKRYVNKVNKYPVTNYYGMWSKSVKPIKNMSKEELIKNLRKFRNNWEKITTINQDLSNLRLKTSTKKELQKIITFYYSNSSKNIARSYLLHKNYNSK